MITRTPFGSLLTSGFNINSIPGLIIKNHLGSIVFPVTIRMISSKNPIPSPPYSTKASFEKYFRTMSLLSLYLSSPSNPRYAQWLWYAPPAMIPIHRNKNAATPNTCHDPFVILTIWYFIPIFLSITIQVFYFLWVKIFLSL